jgi:trk system potassium uptake protein TrkA
MHIIVVGCGNVGSQLAILLSTEGHDVAIIDKNPESFKRLGSAFNGVKFVGYGFDKTTLVEAGIEGCDALAAVTNEDNANMVAAEVASKIFAVPRVVARLYDSEREATFHQLGINYVCGTTMIAQMLLDKLVEGHGHYLTIRGDLELIEFIAGPAVDKQKLVDIQIPNQFRICMVMRDGSSFIPWRETILKDGDLLVAIVKNQSFPKIKKYMRTA